MSLMLAANPGLRAVGAISYPFPSGSDAPIYGQDGNDPPGRPPGGSGGPILTTPIKISGPVQGFPSSPILNPPVSPVIVGGPVSGVPGTNTGTITGGTTPGSGPGSSKKAVAPKTSSMFMWALIAVGVLFALEEAQ